MGCPRRQVSGWRSSLKLIWMTSTGSTPITAKILSQIIQGAYIGNNDVILHVHGGCDAGGGYTDAKLFATYGYLDQTVYGTVTYQDGKEVQVDTCYNGYCLTNEVGEEVLYEPGMVFDLWIAEP